MPFLPKASRFIDTDYIRWIVLTMYFVILKLSPLPILISISYMNDKNVKLLKLINAYFQIYYKKLKQQILKFISNFSLRNWIIKEHLTFFFSLAKGFWCLWPWEIRKYLLQYGRGNSPSNGTAIQQENTGGADRGSRCRQ